MGRVAEVLGSVVTGFEERIDAARAQVDYLDANLARVIDEARGWWFSVSHPEPVPSTIVGNAIRVRERLARLKNDLALFAAEGATEANAAAREKAAAVLSAIISETRTLAEITEPRGIDLDLRVALPTLEDAARALSRVVLAPVREVVDAAGDVIERAGGAVGGAIGDVGEGVGGAVGNVGGGLLDAVGRGWLFALGALALYLSTAKR